MDGKDDLKDIEKRIGSFHLRQRLRFEEDASCGRVSWKKRFFRHFMHIVLKASGGWWIGRRNCERIELTQNEIFFPHLPEIFDGLRILHLSDLHIGMHEPGFRELLLCLSGLEHDLCLLTGDYMHGRQEGLELTIARLRELRDLVDAPIYAVLGNHDSIRLAPPLERVGVKFLINENVCLEKEGEKLFIVGVDDPSRFRLDNLEKAAAGKRKGEFSILLSHSPEIHHQARHAGFDLMLAGHTHGGQICLPGGIPLTLEVHGLARKYGSGLWRTGDMAGYTSRGVGASVAPVRINCRPEASIHILRRSGGV